MFTRLLFISCILVIVGPLHGQVGSSRVVKLPGTNLHSKSPTVYQQLSDSSLSSVYHASWQQADEDLQAVINEDSVSGLQLELERRRRSLANSDSGSEIPADDYQLPKLASVHDPIPAAPLSQISQNDPSRLLTTQPSQPDAVFAEQICYADLTGTPAIPATAHWAAPNFYHLPLLFEEVNLERYGNQRRFQNVASAAQFLGTIPVLPYKIGKHARCNRRYTLRHYRPGDCVPYEIERFQFDAHGGFWQALATTAIVIP